MPALRKIRQKDLPGSRVICFHTLIIKSAPTRLQDVGPPIAVLVVASAEVNAARRRARTGGEATREPSYTSHRPDSDDSEEQSKLLEWAQGAFPSHTFQARARK